MNITGFGFPTSGDDEAEFIKLINSIGLRNFKPHEFLKMGRKHSNPGSAAFGLNRFPPRELWNNIIPTARVLDRLRERLGNPITTLSIYRSPAYNAAIGGATQSLHMQFKAVDFIVTGTTSRPQDWGDALKSMRSQGMFSGGIGIYPGFVHIDTRGANADF